jgi:GntR family transcriptional regulator/MocR family aminotransferase
MLSCGLFLPFTMPKRTVPTPHPSITLDSTSSVPLYKQLYERLRGAILAGQVERGTRLPSTRTLASELGISRTTTALAYEQLLLEGYLESRVGQGTLVSREVPAALLSPPQQKVAQGDNTLTRIAAHVPLLKGLPPSAPVAKRAGVFRSGEGALDLFPYDLWARLIARRARQSLRDVARYQELSGYTPLCRAIAAHVGITRGVRCAPEQVIITSGSQGALDLAIRTLLNPGDQAWIENPGYFGAQGALTVAGARLVPVPVDEQGLEVEAGKRLAPSARVVSTTPSHQFPTGVTMSLHRRLALLEWARETGAWILEDDYDSEFRYTGRPLEALQGLDRDGRVLYIGSFSKTLFPALRLGFLIAPPALVEPLVATRRFINIHPPLLEQMALTDFIEEGHFVRHLRRMVEVYQQRRDALASALMNEMGDKMEVYVPEAGMHLVGWLPAGVDDTAIADRAAEAGLEVSPISKYSLIPLRRGGLLFGYAGTDEAALREGVRQLASLV